MQKLESQIQKSWKTHSENPDEKTVQKLGVQTENMRNYMKLLNTSAKHHSCPRIRRGTRNNKRPAQRSGAAENLNNHGQLSGNAKRGSGVGENKKTRICGKKDTFNDFIPGHLRAMHARL